MRMPAIAAQTYSRCKEDPILGQIWKKVTRVLKGMSNPIKRARFTHEAVDKSLQELFTNPVVNNYVSCKKGCSGCCYTQVSVTRDEAALLSHVAHTKLKHKIDIDRLEKQARAGDNAKDWYKLPYADRRCVFLDSKNECQVYDDRPAVCRSNNVLSPPILCDTRDGIEHPLRLLKTEAADMAIAAAFMNSQETGALPFMLWKMLLQWRKVSREIDQTK